MIAPAQPPLRLCGHLGLSGPDSPLLAGLGRSTAAPDQIDALAAHGFAGVQDLALKLRPEAEQAAMADRMAGLGLALSSFGGDPAAWNTPLWSRRDARAMAAQDASLAASIALARRFGGAGAVCVAGRDADSPPGAQIAAMAENLKRAAEPAARAGLVLLVEPIAEARIPGMLLNALDQGAELVDAVAMPSVRLLFDTGHAAMMGASVPAALRALGGRIGLVQFADADGRRRVDPGLGRLDWPGIVSALDDAGYAGPVELEYEPADASPAGTRAMLDRLVTLFG